jgi:sulfite reductase (NADPH) flavoprotein alpha-component
LWLRVFRAGLGAPARDISAAAPKPSTPPITVLYGSQSGNAEGLAKRLVDTLGRHDIPAVLLDMIDCKPQQLQAAHTLLVVVSTQGEGDPPDRALAFWELLNSRKAPKLAHVKFSVLALGDSSYAKFCETGKQFDARLEALGAQRLHPRVDCDVDFEAPASAWMEAVLGNLPRGNASSPSLMSLADTGQSPIRVATAYTRKNPFNAELLVNQRLTVTGSTKDVRHIELSLAGSGIRYEPGDAIGVVPRNDGERVQELLDALPYAPDAVVEFDSGAMPLNRALQERLDIGLVDRAFMDRYGAAVNARLDKWVEGSEVVDVVREHPPRGLDATGFAKLLRPLAQRLYSIASSLNATPDEAHLTVGVIEYQARGGQRRGVVSGLLAALTDEGASVPIYLHRNGGFRLPAADAPIIMIGPGTGIAPFRAFVAERAATGARGRNWLFFGDRCFETDFLYQTDWLDWRKQGVLTRIDVAFSRDQDQKIYVQDRLRENGAEVWKWLNDGAHVYVCGDAQRMAPDVHAALMDIVRRHGSHSEEQAVEYLAQLQRDRRYQRDVY